MKNIEERFESVGNSTTFGHIINKYDLSTKKVLDIGCGYGEYLAKFGVGSVGITSTHAEVKYGQEKNLDIRSGNAEQVDQIKFETQFDCIWANNLFEHLLSPHAFLVRLKKVSKPDGRIILGVPVVPRMVSLMRLSAFVGALASNHINFFTKETLKLTVERAGWDIEYISPFITGVKIIDSVLSCVAPHMYVVAKNNTKFHYPPKKIKEWEGEEYYKDLLSINGDGQ